jgi:hypothetical protein
MRRMNRAHALGLSFQRPVSMSSFGFVRVVHHGVEK